MRFDHNRSLEMHMQTLFSATYTHLKLPTCYQITQHASDCQVWTRPVTSWQELLQASFTNICQSIHLGSRCVWYGMDPQPPQELPLTHCTAFFPSYPCPSRKNRDALRSIVVQHTNTDTHADLTPTYLCSRITSQDLPIHLCRGIVDLPSAERGDPFKREKRLYLPSLSHQISSVW